MTDSSSFSLTTFSPSGKLVQIEYALNAVGAGSTSLGIKAVDGVVLATEKKLPSPLVDESTVAKISLLTPHIGSVYAGMGPDARVLAAKARKSAQTYYRQYHEAMPVAQLVRETATVMQEFTQSGCVCDARTSHSPGRLAARQTDRDRPVLTATASLFSYAAACVPSACRSWWLVSTTRGRSCTRWTRRGRTLLGRRAP